MRSAEERSRSRETVANSRCQGRGSGKGVLNCCLLHNTIVDNIMRFLLHLHLFLDIHILHANHRNALMLLDRRSPHAYCHFSFFSKSSAIHVQTASVPSTYVFQFLPAYISLLCLQMRRKFLLFLCSVLPPFASVCVDPFPFSLLPFSCASTPAGQLGPM